ncbi:hypothetical protein A3K86_13890 [Photobacterium jeanii]|uniref:Lipoprotein n=1 Tax=Photobacterium jeanii TaxID=858640 RepID=A0A178KAF4_9GAMM|nr:hypothetical protein [Photobacterium jeanii]OAN13662.1 hypothetical protein A3K86_13890 [Photobacterium jeanii]PST88783.1 hypothetical protein C9I91_15755 [Photobacterium jeanii]
MMNEKQFTLYRLVVGVGALLLVGCSQGPAVTGTEAALVPTSAELKLAVKTKKNSDKDKLYQRASDFIVQQFEQDAERIVVTANTKAGKQVQAKLKRNLGKYQQWIEYRVENKPRASVDLFVKSNKTQVIIPPCAPLGQYNVWEQQDGCFSERARNKQLATPSTLLPVVSEMAIEQRENK